ncbi:MAG: hypothetical protein PHV18_07445 [Lachnospiraceae bacterium]|nr:hypothetical protein [Lachnospiraceae bacterium]
MGKAKANRKYKDSLFRLIFSDKKKLLNLYNAMNQTEYTDEGMLEIRTIDDALYMGMKNDISFLIDEEMNLYEAQSTDNPNMALRGLFYLSRLYESYVNQNQLDIYSSVQLKLPMPRYIVFYNGSKWKGETKKLRLSNSFQRSVKEQASEKEAEASLECIATVININITHQTELMTSCRELYEYAYIIAEIRSRLEQGVTLLAAIDSAIENCIKENVLKEFLLKHRGEVCQVILGEYDEKLHIKNEREIAKAEGIAEGIAEGKLGNFINLVCKKLKKNTPVPVIAAELEEDLDTIQRICKIAGNYAPDYDEEKILMEYMLSEKKTL